jgi:molybdate-binding protein/transcriptional regulator with XRE-family HTH domain
MMVPMTKQHVNRVREQRQARGLSQAELAVQSGVSRPAVSAIEIGRLVPSVAAALALARVFGCSVEELFDSGSRSDLQWAWAPDRDPCRYWRARVNGKMWLYPVESQGPTSVAHDGVSQAGVCKHSGQTNPETTLVMASCDPAAAFLVEAFAQATGGRLLVFQRSSRQALELLGRGVIHAAGIHFATAAHPEGNALLVREVLGEGHRLVRVSSWEEGVCVNSAAQVSSIDEAVRLKLRWVGRDPGSAAGQCLAELLPEGARPRRQAPDHRGVAMAVRWGWADAGVCHRFVTEDGGLDFLSVRSEQYDLCFAESAAADPRIVGLLNVLRSRSFKKLVSELPGFDSSGAGTVEEVAG